MTDLEKAKSALSGHSLALVRGDEVKLFDGKGIAPLVKAVEKGNLSGFSAADLVVGKAAALLMTSAGITCVFAKCVSEAGLKVLKSHGIACSYDVIAEKIMNRDGTDVCPMEKTVQNIDDPSAALVAIKQKLAELMQKSL